MRWTALIFGVLAGCGQATRPDPSLTSSYIWRMADDRFGGISGISMADGGRSFIAVGDRGVFITGQVDRDQTGQITAIINTVITPMLPPHHSGSELDSEGIAIRQDGTVFVSLEGRHQILSFGGISHTPQALPQHPAFTTLQANGSLEALAIGPDGALFTIPERSGRAVWPFPVFRFQNGAWDIPFTIPRSDQFLITGADIGPDGRLYVLERGFTGVGFRTRVRRMALDGSGIETLLQTSNATHDNLEGISVWSSPAGMRMTLVSDDNFRALQQTELVEYAISD